VVSRNGFADSIQLSVSGLPAGASATFAKDLIAGAGTTTLTVTPGCAAAGTYSLTVSGASSNFADAPLTLTISPAAFADFCLAPSPDSLPVTYGGSATSQVSIVRAGGAGRLLSCDIWGLPEWVTGSIGNEGYIEPGDKTVPFVIQDSDGAPGQYALTIDCGTWDMGPLVQHTAQVTLFIQ
jgi:hypothetical protein